jgi:hypothetical protein
MKHIKKFEDFLNEAKLNESEFQTLLNDLQDSIDSKNLDILDWDEEDLDNIARAEMYDTLAAELHDILQDDFSRWTEKDLTFWVKKMEKRFKPKLFSVFIWSTFKRRSQEIQYVESEIRDLKQQLVELDNDMRMEAGQKGDNWTDADANRYGEQMMAAENEIEKLNKKLDRKYWTKDITKAATKVSKDIIKILNEL